ncbi:MAG: hypothetical protein ACNA8K_16860 [Cyclonatronaceae bacterium]
MGRGLVIIVTGMVFIFGMIQLGISNRHNSETEINIDYASWVQARNVAASGAEVAVSQLIANKAWRPVNGLFELDLAGYMADVSVIDNTIDASIGLKQARVLSEATIGGRTARVNALLQERSQLPVSEGAMAIYSPDVVFLANGTGFLISGEDGAETDDDQKYGIATGNSLVYDKVMDELNKNQELLVKGKGGEPSVAEVRDRNEELMELVDWYYNIANTTDFGTVYDDLIIDGQMQLGTRENPQITYVNDLMQVSGNGSGAGILIVGPEGRLDMSGGGNRDFHFDGLVIVMGEASISGNIKVNGTMLFGGTQPSIEISIGGSVEVKYSSEALASLDPFLSGSGVPIDLPFELISMYE